MKNGPLLIQALRLAGSRPARHANCPRHIRSRPGYSTLPVLRLQLQRALEGGASLIVLAQLEQRDSDVVLQLLFIAAAASGA